MSVEEYLKYTGKPNAEYIDGELRPKPVPTKPHSHIEFQLETLLVKQGVEALHEVTVRLSSTKFLIPDVIADPVIEDPIPPSPSYSVSRSSHPKIASVQCSLSARTTMLGASPIAGSSIQ